MTDMSIAQTGDSAAASERDGVSSTPPGALTIDTDGHNPDYKGLPRRMLLTKNDGIGADSIISPTDAPSPVTRAVDGLARRKPAAPNPQQRIVGGFETSNDKRSSPLVQERTL